MELRLALFEEGFHSLFDVSRAPGDSLIPSFEIKDAFEGEILALVHGGLGKAVGQWRTACEAVRFPLG